jgi:hypothetical protein
MSIRKASTSERALRHRERRKSLKGLKDFGDAGFRAKRTLGQLADPLAARLRQEPSGNGLSSGEEHGIGG